MIPPMHTSTTTRSSVAALLAAVTLLSGCLTIEENYTFKQDGSGSMEYVVDMSAMMELLRSIEELGDGKKEKGGGGSGDGMDLTDQAAQLKKIPGIKKVKSRSEKDGSVQRLTFLFADLRALNQALNQLMPDSTGVQAEFFRWEGNTLVRGNNHFAPSLGEELASGPDPDSADANAVLQSMKYKYSFTFKAPITTVENAEGVNTERPDERTVRLDTDWSVIMNDPKALDVRITLAP